MASNYNEMRLSETELGYVDKEAILISKIGKEVTYLSRDIIHVFSNISLASRKKREADATIPAMNYVQTARWESERLIKKIENKSPKIQSAIKQLILLIKHNEKITKYLEIEDKSIKELLGLEKNLFSILRLYDSKLTKLNSVFNTRTLRAVVVARAINFNCKKIMDKGAHSVKYDILSNAKFEKDVIVLERYFASLPLAFERLSEIFRHMRNLEVKLEQLEKIKK
ncbi:hypothetical protein HN924_00810 [Candidatus Woesearchaeota archaeon]|jgi:hypothetical protein|nr:hypothetical protein [Candidatus Woesearchaeota archaeon]MBT7062494.1 hypothetical protein [Candidatus Woesearchaeota archaeon]MBT7402323.1 hypothetical protein [Candidatus Woesearchaeota archaeon]